MPTVYWVLPARSAGDWLVLDPNEADTKKFIDFTTAEYYAVGLAQTHAPSQIRILDDFGLTETRAFDLGKAFSEAK